MDAGLVRKPQPQDRCMVGRTTGSRSAVLSGRPLPARTVPAATTAAYPAGRTSPQAGPAPAATPPAYPAGRTSPQAGPVRRVTAAARPRALPPATPTRATGGA